MMRIFDNWLEDFAKFLGWNISPKSIEEWEILSVMAELVDEF